MKKYSRKQKLNLIIACSFIGLSAYLGSYSLFENALTPWQREQKIDFDKGTGATKFNAHINAASIGGLAFCISAVSIITYVKFRNRK